MILTNKCKDDFLKIFGVDDEDKNISLQYFNMKSDVERNALIIDFFDSKGINILIHNLDFQNWWYYEVKYFPHKEEGKIMKDSRQKATEEAIKFANEYYNSKCPCCNGTGVVEGEHAEDVEGCLTCNGSGKL